MKRRRIIYEQLLKMDSAGDHSASELFDLVKNEDKKITRDEVESFIQFLIDSDYLFSTKSLTGHDEIKFMTKDSLKSYRLELDSNDAIEKKSSRRFLVGSIITVVLAVIGWMIKN